jgi:hypothetical protein
MEPKDVVPYLQKKIEKLFKEPPALLKEPYLFYTLASIPLCIVGGTLLYRLLCKKKDTV